MADKRTKTRTTKVLLVDDIRENLLALSALLAQLDIEIISTTSAAEAMELLLRQSDFALAVIDVQMPEINGFELAESMRSLQRTRHIPIVFVSAGSAEAGYSFKGYECGAVDFLYKPLDSHAVRSKVKIFIKLYQQRRVLNEQVIALQQAQQEQQRLLDELQKTQGELRQAMRLRDDFISVISHELRTPLNTMTLELYSRRMQMENKVEGAFSPQNIQKMLAIDERQLDRLVRLINDMTDVSRIRTGQLSIRPIAIDLSALVRRIADQFSAQIDSAGSALCLQGCDVSITARVDEFRIEQAILNLLTNAIRYCEHKPIEIHLDDRGDLIRIGVRDYGKGIDPEDQRRIFNQFERGLNERKGSGLGLGLFIANQIVRAHGGALAVDSRLGEGALFTLTLPKKHLFPNEG